MLYSVVASVLRKGDPTREVALGLCRQIGRAKDAEFVYEIDARGGVKDLGTGYDGVEGSDVLHSMLCNSMRRLKRQMRKRGSLLLPGRDVWCWEVMAQKLTVRSTFDSRVSRSVARNNKALRTCIDAWQVKDWTDVLFFDTGFSGSIPRAIAKAEGLDEINMLLLSSADTSKQIFRTHTGSRKKALAFEYLAKYFLSGTHRAGDPYQELSSLDEFIKASLLTIWLWHHVSPTRLPSYRDKKIPRLTAAQKKAQIAAHYAKTKINPDNVGSLSFGNPIFTSNDTFTPVTGSSTSTQNFNITTTGASTGWDLTAQWGTDNATTLNQLWGAGAAGQVIVDGATGWTPPKSILDEYQEEWKKEMDNQVIKSLLDKAGGDPSKIPAKDVPSHLLYQQVPIDPPKKSFSPGSEHKLKFIDPNSLQLVSGKNPKVNLEALEDLSALGINPAEALASMEPSSDGFGIGQYPGPPVVQADALKSLACMNPNESALPEVDLKVVTLPPKEGEQFSSIVKQTSLTKPDGTKVIIQAPLTG